MNDPCMTPEEYKMYRALRRLGYSLEAALVCCVGAAQAAEIAELAIKNYAEKENK